MPDVDEPLRRRLREELDGVRPLYSTPRYKTVVSHRWTWRLAPAMLAATVLAVLGLTAYAGSPNPVVWTEHVVTVVHPATTSPSPEQTPAQATHNPEPSEQPEPSESPEPRESPESPEPDKSHDGHDGETSDSGGGERS